MTYFPKIIVTKIPRSYGFVANGDTGAYTNVNEKYDDINNSWSSMSNVIGIAASSMSGGEHNGYSYLVGGLNNGANPNSKYDSNTDTWTVKTVVTTAYYSGSPVLSLERFMYVMGGVSATTANQQYDDVANTWAAKTAINARSYNSGFVTGGYAFVCIGYNVTELATTDRYDDILNTITTRATANTARYYGGSSHLNSYGYTVQGRDTVNSVLPTTEVYDEINNTWTAKTNTNNNLRGNVAFEQNNYLYAACGYTGAAVSNKLDKYDDKANTWTAKTAVTTARVDSSGFSTGPLSQANNIQNQGFFETMRRVNRSLISVDVSASRAINSTYTNNASYNLKVEATFRCVVTVAGGNAYIQGKSDTNTPPTTVATGIVGIESGLLSEDNSFQISFIVRPTYNYRIDSATTNGTATLGKWFEIPIK